MHPEHSFLDQEMDLVQGEIVKITEIVDKDWYRGEKQRNLPKRSKMRMITAKLHKMRTLTTETPKRPG